MDTLIVKVWKLDFAAFNSPTVKFVALAIARRSYDSGQCWAKQATLAADTGLSAKTVARAIGEMEAGGWAVKRARRRPDGTKGTDIIWLTLPDVVLNADTVTAKARPDPEDVDPDNDPRLSLPVDSVSFDQRTLGAQPDPTESELNKTREDSRTDKNPPTPKGALLADSEIDAAVSLIWQRASDMGRQRSSKADVRTALVGCLRRGHPMELILRGMGAYFASPDATKNGGEFQAGPHVKLNKDRWQSFLADMPTAPPVGAPVSAPRPTSDIGTDEAPGPALQRAWMGQWKLSGGWDASVRGPAPGRPGCRVADAIQRENGAEPFAPIIEDSFLDDDSAAFD